MKTIEQIVNENWYTIKELKKCKYCNWCGWKWGINFELLMKSLPYFRKDKGKQLLEDLHLLCNMHDIWFHKWWWVVDFIKANYKFALWVCELIYWTKTIDRWLIFIIIFLGTTLFWRKYFNW